MFFTPHATFGKPLEAVIIAIVQPIVKIHACINQKPLLFLSSKPHTAFIGNIKTGDRFCR